MKLLYLLFFLSIGPILKAQDRIIDFNGIVRERIRKNITNTFCIYIKDLKEDRMIYTDDEEDLGNVEHPLGSIIKLFSIISKFKNHPVNISETHFCGGYDENTPEVIKCWLKEGHKNISLIPALANSCNTYFYYFVQEIDFNLFLETLREWGILKSSENWGKKFITREDQIRAMIGKMNVLKLRPLDLIESCAKLLQDRKKVLSEVRDVLMDGMRLCYIYGTASKARKKLNLSPDLPILCKTGTGIFEDDGEIDIKKTNGSFLGLLNSRYLIFVFALETAGADVPATIGLTMLQEINRAQTED